MKFNHIGIACFSIEKTAPFYLGLGYSKSDTVFDPIQNVRICFLSHTEMPTLELLEPCDEKSPVNDTLRKNGVSPYHICYESDEIDNSVSKLKEMKFYPLSKPVSAVAFNGKKVCFLFRNDVGLLELVEK